MTIENVRVPVADNERDPVLKDMGEKGYTLVAVTEDGSSTAGFGRHGTMRFWSLYFTRVVPEEM
jgi:hypothetical protein